MIRISTLPFVLLPFIAFGLSIDVPKRNPCNYLSHTTDSPIKVLIKNKNLIIKKPYNITTFINGEYYSHISETNGYIYLSDSIPQNADVKILVRGSDSVGRSSNGTKLSNKMIKKRVYKFKYKHWENIVVKIIYKKKIHLFEKRLYGICPANNW